MIFIKTVIVCLLVITVGTFGANPLRCYDCNSVLQPNCEDPFNSTNIKSVNCSQIRYDFGQFKIGTMDPNPSVYMQRAPADAQFECFAYKKTFANNHSEVMRSCKIVDSVDFCTAIVENSGQAHYNISRCFTCQKDDCNSAENPKISTVLGLVLVSIVLMHK